MLGEILPKLPFAITPIDSREDVPSLAPLLYSGDYTGLKLGRYKPGNGAEVAEQVGRSDTEVASGSNHASGLQEKERRISDVLEYAIAPTKVDGVVFERPGFVFPD